MIKLAICLLLSGTGSVALQPETRPAEQVLDGALSLVETGRVSEAIQVLERQRDADGLSDRGAALLGRLYLDVDLPEEAYGVLEPLAVEDDADREILATAGRAAFAVGRRDEGESWTRRAVELAPESDAAQAYGVYLGREGRFEEAVQVLAPFVSAHPGDQGSALALAMAALKIGAVEEASTALEKLPPDNPGANMLRGELALQRGEPHRARELLESAWESRPPGLEMDLRRMLGEVFVTTGEAQRAIELLSGFQRGEPGLAVLLSRALYQTGNAEAAAEVLAPYARAVFAVDESSPRAQVALAVGIATESGRALVALDRGAEAEGPLRRAALLLPSNPETWNVLAHALIAQGKTQAAREAVVRFHRLSDTPLVEN